MSLKTKKSSYDDNIFKYLENAGIIIEKNPSLTNDKVTVVFDNGVESYLDEDYTLFTSNYDSNYNDCLVEYKNTTNDQNKYNEFIKETSYISGELKCELFKSPEIYNNAA